MNLVGRRCIITGASRGLGAAIARTFWTEGADLLLVARSGLELTRLIGELGTRPNQRVHAMVCDLNDPAAPEGIVEQARQILGGVSVVVNNAAKQGPIGPVWENDWAEWEETFRVDFLSVVSLCRHCVPVMAAGGGGKIISISGGGATGPRPRFSAYGTAKTALVRFSEVLAEEAAPYGIAVNCVAPGAMNSSLTEAIRSAGSARAGATEYEAASKLLERGSEVLDRAAALCEFLASAKSDGITGKLISAVWDPWATLSAHRADLEGTDVYTLRRITPQERGLSWAK